MTAVTLTRTPLCDSRWIRLYDGCASVLVIGTFTNTLAPQDAISRAWDSISPKPSESTSNEIGRSGMAASASRAKVA